MREPPQELGVFQSPSGNDGEQSLRASVSDSGWIVPVPVCRRIRIKLLDGRNAGN